jgi:hypothetical protein
MEFNGWTASQIDDIEPEHFPTMIDSIVVGYTNSRSFTSLKLHRIG